MLRTALGTQCVLKQRSLLSSLMPPSSFLVSRQSPADSISQISNPSSFLHLHDYPLSAGNSIQYSDTCLVPLLPLLPASNLFSTQQQGGGELLKAQIGSWDPTPLLIKTFRSSPMPSTLLQYRSFCVILSPPPPSGLPDSLLLILKAKARCHGLRGVLFPGQIPGSVPPQPTPCVPDYSTFACCVTMIVSGPVCLPGSKANTLSLGIQQTVSRSYCCLHGQHHCHHHHLSLARSHHHLLL